MSELFTSTGGARIGIMNASWPLAKLSSTSDQLTLAVKILGTYSFSPHQISAIEKYGIIPVIGWGIKIVHTHPDYPQRIIFWSMGSPDKVLQGIRDSGFLSLALPSAIPERAGLALRWQTIVVFIIAWNTSFFLGLDFSASTPVAPTPFILIPLLFGFVFSLAALKSSSFQRLILKRNRSVLEIAPLLRLMAFILGCMLLIFSVLLACGAFSHR